MQGPTDRRAATLLNRSALSEIVITAGFAISKAERPRQNATSTGIQC